MKERIPSVIEKPKPERMLTEEATLLKRVVKSRAAQWLAGAALLLSAEGCASFRDYRRVVSSDMGVDFMPAASEATSTTTGGMALASVTFTERTPQERVEIAEREHDPDFIFMGDELIHETPAGPMLQVEAIAGRWWQEMRPGTVYLGSDGHRYALLPFRRDIQRFASIERDALPEYEFVLPASELSPAVLAEGRPPRMELRVSDDTTRELRQVGGDPGRRGVRAIGAEIIREPAVIEERLEWDPANEPVNPIPTTSEFIAQMIGQEDHRVPYIFYLVRSEAEHEDELNRYALAETVELDRRAREEADSE